jgi:hypothetical protein
LTDIVTNGDLLDVRRFLNRLNTHEYAMIESGKGSLSEPLSGDYDFMGGYSYDAEVISNSFQMKRLNLTNRESLLDLTYERIVADLESSLGEYRQLNLKVAGTTDSKNTPYTPI